MSEHPAGWGIETDADNPQPPVWPVCPTCNVAWAYRKFMSTSRGTVWAWGKDCKHKVDPVLHTKDGLYEPAEAAS